MAAGLPVVGSRVGGIPELVEDGVTGFVVEPENPEPLAVALDALAGDPERRRQMGEAGRARAVERFSAEGIAAGPSRCTVAARILHVIAGSDRRRGAYLRLGLPGGQGGRPRGLRRGCAGSASGGALW